MLVWIVLSGRVVVLVALVVSLIVIGALIEFVSWWMTIGSSLHERGGRPPLTSLKPYVRRAAAGWAAVVLERAGVVDIDTSAGPEVEGPAAPVLGQAEVLRAIWVSMLSVSVSQLMPAYQRAAKTAWTSTRAAPPSR